MVVVAISMTDDLFNRIEKARNGFYDKKAVVFKRSPFYAKLLERGLTLMDKEKNNGTGTTNNR